MVKDTDLPLVLEPPAAAMLIADDEALFHEANAAAVALLKYSEPELKSMHVWDITEAPQRGDALTMWREFLTAGHQSGVYQIRRSDGRRVTVQYEAVAHFRPGRHLSVLRPVSRAQPGSRPLDECPFERPFPRDFDGCPAYQPLLAHMADSRDQAVSPVWTCEHLAATRIPGQSRYYGRCGLGDAVGRSQWLFAAGTRLLEIRQLRMDFYREAEAQLGELIAAQAASRFAPGRPEEGRRLQAATSAVLDALDAFARRNRRDFEAAGLDPVSLRNCVEATLKHDLRELKVAGLRPLAAMVADYPWAVQAFLRPDLVPAGAGGIRV